MSARHVIKISKRDEDDFLVKAKLTYINDNGDADGVWSSIYYKDGRYAYGFKNTNDKRHDNLIEGRWKLEDNELFVSRTHAIPHQYTCVSREYWYMEELEALIMANNHIVERHLLGVGND